MSPADAVLAKMVAAWLEWPGRTPEGYNAWCSAGARDLVHATLWAMSSPLHAAGLVDMNDGTARAKGRDLLDRARKAGVLP